MSGHVSNIFFEKSNIYRDRNTFRLSTFSIPISNYQESSLKETVFLRDTCLGNTIIHDVSPGFEQVLDTWNVFQLSLNDNSCSCFKSD